MSRGMRDFGYKIIFKLALQARVSGYSVLGMKSRDVYESLSNAQDQLMQLRLKLITRFAFFDSFAS